MCLILLFMPDPMILLMMIEIRDKFWVQGLRNAAKRIWLNCQLCKKRGASPTIPRMGLMPVALLVDLQRLRKNGLGLLYRFLMVRNAKRFGVIFMCIWKLLPCRDQFNNGVKIIYCNKQINFLKKIRPWGKQKLLNELISHQCA